MPTPYENRIVAFLDILGFSALVGQLASHPDLRKKVHRALSEIRGYKESSLRNETAQRTLEVSVFSDSIAISGAPDELTTIISSASHLQCQLLGLGILVRGGISIGPTFHAEDLLYGEGMLKAHELESKTAIYPRIVIDPQLIGPSDAGLCAMFLRKDTDQFWFVDPYASGGLPDGSEGLLEDGWDPNAVYLEIVGRIIDQQLVELTEERKLEKWRWQQRWHAVAVKELSSYGKPRLWWLMEQARKKGIIRQSTTMTIQPGVAQKPSRKWTD